MVALNLIEDPTLEAMHKAIEAAGQQPTKVRDYVSPSMIGEPCERKIWYHMRGYEGEPINHKGLYAIEDGHRTESLIIERLRRVDGVTIWDKDKSGEQYGFHDELMKGFVDGIIVGILQAPRTVHVFEVKCCNEKKFNKLNDLKEKFGEKQALEQWDYTYFIQAQTYMKRFQLDRHYLVCATPGGRDVTSCRTEFQPSISDAIDGKAGRVISAKEPPERIGSSKSFYQCKYCKFRETCWAE